MVDSPKKPIKKPLAAKASQPLSSKPPQAVLPTVTVVGVGASAGGLEAFTLLLKFLPVDTGMAFVLVQHLDPNHESVLAHLLTKATSMPVMEARNNLQVQPNHVYVIPPDTALAISKGLLKISPRSRNRVLHLPIDAFFESLAAEKHERAIGVVLSGSASDGMLGLEAIKAEGGITFAQDNSAKYDSMPKSAIAAGCVDFVLSPQSIAKELALIAKHPYINGTFSPVELQTTAKSTAKGKLPDSPGAAGKSSPQGVAPDDVRKVFHLLHHHCGVDFSEYRLNTIHRRIARRMVLGRHNSMEKYIAFLSKHPAELDSLFSDFLISVTSFFRNPDVFKAIKTKVFPELLKNHRNPDDPVRVWVPACSSGQEAYSIAIAYAEFAQDIDHPPGIQIFATDLNDAVLEKARRGHYVKALVQDLSPKQLERFFVQEESGYRVCKALREQVVFAHHNIVCDPPFSRMDLITCRNLLIYLESSLQNKLIPAFHYALKPGGFLVLGASESIGQFTELFAPHDKKQKVFFKQNAPSPSTRPLPSPKPSPLTLLPQRAHMPDLKGRPPAPAVRSGMDAQREADRLIANRFAPPCVLVNADFQILQFRGATGDYLKPPSGHATFDLLKMARDGLMAALRATLNQAKKLGKSVRRQGVRVQSNDTIQRVTLQVIPLRNLKDSCYLIVFEPEVSGHTSSAAPKPALNVLGNKDAARQITLLTRELAETREYLQSVQEENELANEELQAFGEEVQSSNEELQSINEEMETSKEELESSNEELTTVNEEMTHRGIELGRLNTDLTNLQVSIDTAIILFSLDLVIRRFTPPAQKLFNLLATDIGRPLGGVRHNLDITDLEHLLTQVMDTVALHQREVQDNTGRWYSLRARPYMTLESKIDGVVLMLVDIDALKRNEQKINAVNNYAQAILRSARDPIVVLREDFAINTGNIPFYTLFSLTAAQAQGQSIFQINPKAWDISKLKSLLADIIATGTPFDDFQITLEFPGQSIRTMVLNGRPLDHSEAMPGRILLSMKDITQRVAFEAQRQTLLANEQAARMEAQAANRAKDVFLATLSHEIRTPLSAIMAWATLLRRGKINLADQQEGLSVIERNVRVQTQLIDDVLDISRIVSGKLRLNITSSDLKTVVAAAMGVVQVAADAKQIKLESTLADIGPFMCDPVRMQQVAWNLISNAIKFTPQGGTVRITLATEDNQIILRVQDDGEGITADFLPHVFDRFRQADGSTTKTHGGLGLGLSIVKHIVEQHGGTCAVQSAGPGQGATFVIRLPIQDTKDTKPNTQNKLHPALTSTQDLPQTRLDGLAILLVEDQDDTRRLLEKVFEAAGARVTSASSGLEALKTLANANPDLIVSDIGMPGMDGYELIGRIRASGFSANELPALALTAFAHKEDRTRALDAGFQEHVSKPVDPYELTRIIAALARTRQAPGSLG
jgi:two-component system, chemotaxis family, CheB/CheR fusion protein